MATFKKSYPLNFFDLIAAVVTTFFCIPKLKFGAQELIGFSVVVLLEGGTIAN